MTVQDRGCRSQQLQVFLWRAASTTQGSLDLTEASASIVRGDLQERDRLWGMHTMSCVQYIAGRQHFLKAVHVQRWFDGRRRRTVHTVICGDVQGSIWEHCLRHVPWEHNICGWELTKHKLLVQHWVQRASGLAVRALRRSVLQDCCGPGRAALTSIRGALACCR